MSLRIFHLQSSLNLEQLAVLIASIFDLPAFVERDSANYPDGHYFHSASPNFTFKIAKESDEEWNDFQYWLVLSSQQSGDNVRDEQAVFTEACDEIIVKLLSQEIGVGREVSHDDTELRREIYSRDSKGNLKLNVETRTRRFT